MPAAAPAAATPAPPKAPQKPGGANGASAGRRRLDEACLEQHPALSRNQVQSWIAQGRVTVDGRPATKAGQAVPRRAVVVVDAREERFVCRAGYKLERALDHFLLDVRGRVCLDAGLSTGGFSDCLMQRGARMVYGVDVGYGQVAGKLRSEADGQSTGAAGVGTGTGAAGAAGAAMLPRLAILERTNLRHLRPEDLKPGCWAFDAVAAAEGADDGAAAATVRGGDGGGGASAPAPAPPPPSSPPPVSLVTLDLSFISVLKVLPAVVGVLLAGRQELRRQQALLREGAGGVGVAERRAAEAQAEAAAPGPTAGETAAAAPGPLPPPPPPSLRDALPRPAVVVLIKPQFEAGRRQVGSGGVVRDPAVHRAVVERVSAAVARCGFSCRGVIESPLKGEKGGNTEFLGLFVADGEDDGAGLSLEGAMAAAAGMAAGEGEREEGRREEAGGGGGARRAMK